MVERCGTNDPPVRERPRVLPAAPVPAARRAGTAIIVLGLLLLLVVCLAWTPWYWHSHAPALQGFACGIVVCVGVMVLYWRFSLGLLVAAILLLGGCGALGSLTGNLHSCTFRIRCRNGYDSSYSGDMNEDLRLLREGLVETLREENVLAGDPCPITVEQGYDAVKLGLKVHADPRVKGFGAVVQRFITLKYGYAENRTEGVRYYVAEVAARFGDKAARRVAERSATLVNNEDVKEQFLVQSRAAR